MRRLVVVLLLSGCSALPVQIQSDPAVMQSLNQHTVVLNAMGTYIKELQDSGALPKPKESVK